MTFGREKAGENMFELLLAVEKILMNNAIQINDEESSNFHRFLKVPGSTCI